MKKLFQTLALVSLATAGMIVSSCEVENINTTFEPTAAVATVTVHAFDVTNGGKDISKESDLKISTDLNSANLAINGNIITITGTPAIPETKFTVFATYGKLTGESLSPVIVTPILAGGIGTYDATVLVGEIKGNYFCNQIGGEITDIKVGEFFSVHGFAHYVHPYDQAHGEVLGNWLYNETEFILNTDVKYTAESGVILKECSCKKEAGLSATDDAIVDIYYADLTYVEAKPVETVLPIKVSAYSRYSAFGTKLYTTRNYELVRHEAGQGIDDVVLATFTIKEVSTKAEYCEAAMPGHEGHYIHGHGHDDVHGYSSNAGGGIIWAE